MFNFKFTQDPKDVRIALNVICNGIVALALLPIVDVAFRFTEAPVRVVAFGIIMTAIAAIIYFVVNRQIPVPEDPVVETEEASVTVGDRVATVKVPKMPDYLPKVGPESAILYRLIRHSIVLTPYVLVTVTALGSTVLLLTSKLSVQAVNGMFLFLEVMCIVLILFDRRHDILLKERVQTVLMCILFATAIIYVWTSQQQVNVYFGQLALIVITVVAKFYLWKRTTIVATKKVMLYMIRTPLGNIAPSIEIRAASAPNITQSLLDIILDTCTIHLDTSAEENGRYKSLRWVRKPDEVRPLFGQPTSAELKRNERETKLREKALKERRKQLRKDVRTEKQASKQARKNERNEEQAS